MIIYATLDQNGAPVQLPVGTPFNTFRKRVEDDHDSAVNLGAPIGTPVAFEVTHRASALAEWAAADFDRYCVQQLELAAPPYGERIAEVTLTVDQAGQITAAPVLEAVPLEELQAEKRDAAVAEYQTRRQSEFPWNFAAITAKDDLGADLGAAGAQTLQMREGLGADDQKNWLAAANAALALEAAGQGATVLALKTTANVWVQTTATEVANVLLRGDGTQLSAVQRETAMLQHVGALKAQIAAAADVAALAAIDVTAGWPA